MRNPLGTLLTLFFMVGACGASEPPVRIAATVDLTPFEILGRDGRVRFQMDREGKIVSGGEGPIATLCEDGSLLDKDGDLRARLSPEGHLGDGAGGLVAKISESGAVVWADGKTARWLDDGVFEMSHLNIKPMLKPKVLKSKIAPTILLVAFFTLTAGIEVE